MVLPSAFIGQEIFGAPYFTGSAVVFLHSGMGRESTGTSAMVPSGSLQYFLTKIIVTKYTSADFINRRVPKIFATFSYLDDIQY